MQEDSYSSSCGLLKRSLYQFFYWLVTFNAIPFALYCVLQVYEVFQVLLVAAHMNPDVVEYSENVWYERLEFFSGISTNGYGDITAYVYLVSCGIILLQCIFFGFFITVSGNTALGQINRYILKLISILCFISTKTLFIPITYALTHYNRAVEHLFEETTPDDSYYAIFLAITLFVLFLFFLTSVVVKLLFHTNNPKHKLPWAQLSTNFSLTIQLAKLILGLLFLMDDGTIKAWLCAGFTGVISLLAVYFLLYDPRPESQLVFFLELCVPAVLLANTIGTFFELVIVEIGIYTLCVGILGVLLAILFLYLKWCIIKNRLYMLSSPEDSANCKQFLECVRVLFSISSNMKYNSTSRGLITEFMIAHCKTCAFPVCSCQKLVSKLLKRTERDSLGSPAQKSVTRASRKMSKIETGGAMSYESDRKFKEFETYMAKFLLKLIEYKMTSQVLSERDKISLRLESAYRQDEEESSVSASLLLNAANYSFISFQQEYFVFCTTQQVLTRLEKTVRREEEESKIMKLIKQQQLFIAYVDSITQAGTGFMLFWAQLQKETPDMKAILTRGSEIADLLVKIQKQRDEIEKLSSESVKVNIIYALLLNYLLTDLEGAYFYRKQAMQSMEQRNRATLLEEQLEKAYGCNSDCGVAILNEVGDFENCNREFVSIFGYSKSEMKTIAGLSRLMPPCVGKRHIHLMKECVSLSKERTSHLTNEVSVMGMNAAGFVIPVSVIRKIQISTDLKIHFVVLARNCNNAAVYTDDPTTNIPVNKALLFVLSKTYKIVGMNSTVLKILGFSIENTALWRYNYSSNKASILPMLNKTGELLEIDSNSISYHQVKVDLSYLQRKLSRSLLDSIEDESSALTSGELPQKSLEVPMHVWFHPRLVKVNVNGTRVEIRYTMCVMTFTDDFFITGSPLLLGRLSSSHVERTSAGKPLFKAFDDNNALDDLCSVSVSSSSGTFSFNFFVASSTDKTVGKIKDFKTTLAQQEGSWSSKLLCRSALVFAILFSSFIIVAIVLGFSGINTMGSYMKYISLQYERLEHLLKAIFSLRIGRQHYYCEEPDSSPVINNRIAFYSSLVKKSLRVVQNELESYSLEKYCKDCKEKYATIPVLELEPPFNADKVKSYSKSMNALNYVIYRIASRADYGFFSGKNCLLNDSLDPAMATSEWNFFFTVYNGKNTVRPMLEGLAAEISASALEINEENYEKQKWVAISLTVAIILCQFLLYPFVRNVNGKIATGMRLVFEMKLSELEKIEADSRKFVELLGKEYKFLLAEVDKIGEKSVEDIAEGLGMVKISFNVNQSTNKMKDATDEERETLKEEKSKEELNIARKLKGVQDEIKTSSRSNKCALLFLIIFTLAYGAQFLYKYLANQATKEAGEYLIKGLTGFCQKNNALLAVILFNEENIATENMDLMQLYLMGSEMGDLILIEAQGDIISFWPELGKYITRIYFSELCDAINEGAACKALYSGLMNKGLRGVLFNIYTNINTVYNTYMVSLPQNSTQRKMLFSHPAELAAVDIFARYIAAVEKGVQRELKKALNSYLSSEKEQQYIQTSVLFGIVLLSLIYISVFVISAMQTKIVAIRKLILILPIYYLKNKGKEIDSILTILS